MEISCEHSKLGKHKLVLNLQQKSSWPYCANTRVRSCQHAGQPKPRFYVENLLSGDVLTINKYDRAIHFLDIRTPWFDFYVLLSANICL